jgi:hypothetical protein
MRLKTIITILFAAACTVGAVKQANAGLFISISVAPPALPVYVQPAVPGPGYIWTPGYWAWDDDAGDYYWVPGAWVAAPQPGLLWTPGYWGYDDGGVYVWHGGYWGPHIGFYGGVNYGFGYGGVGFAGGYWQGGAFFYNRSVVNVGGGAHITNVYNKTVIVNNNVTNVSFNGGSGGINAKPNAQELQAANEPHVQPTSEQMNHQQLASKNKDLRASVNHGKPAIAAVSKAGDYSKASIVPAKSAGSPLKGPGTNKQQTSNKGTNGNGNGKPNNPSKANLSRTPPKGTNTNTHPQNTKKNPPKKPT